VLHSTQLIGHAARLLYVTIIVLLRSDNWD